MDKNYSKLFQALDPVDVPEGLSSSIIAKIRKEQQRNARLQLAISAPLAFISGVAVVFTFQYLAQELSRSGLGDYFSVLFSDGGAVLTYWREFALSLLEQIPILSMILFLSATLALLGSMRSLVKNIQTNFSFA